MDSCSFEGNALTLRGIRVPYIHYEGQPIGEDVWMPAKAVMRVTGESNITHFLDRVHSDDQVSFGQLVEGRGLPLHGCYGFVTPPNVDDHNQQKAIWINESGFYAGLLGSRKPECREFQRWVTREVLPKIRRAGFFSLFAQPNVEQEVAELRAAVQALQASHSVLEVARGGAGDQAEQRWLMEHGRDASAERDIYFAQGPLDLAGFMASRLPTDQHWVIRHVKGEFAREVKRRRVALYEETGDRFWVARMQAQWRIAYVAADRDILDQVWGDEATQQYVERQLADCRLAPCTRAPARLRVTHGPYRRPPQGGSANVTRQALDNLFGR